MTNKGQISPIILWALGIVSSAFLGYGAWTASAVNSIRDGTKETQTARTQDIQRITTLEADQITLKDDVREIKTDVKEILRRIK